ncbi:MAG: DUF72 domain-containing protein [Haloarculaceae archaeon]
MTDVRVGTCGYGYYDPPEGWKETYPSKLAAFAAAFEHLELNRTFYELPMVSTVERWREEADEGHEAADAEGEFTFSLKAWQAMTHPISSPTWRDHDEDLTETEREGVGYLRPNETVRSAWRETRERALALEAEVVVLQTPPSFDASETHEENVRDLLEGIDREGLSIAWEPRGDWPDHPCRVASICEDLELIHVTDLMRREPLDGGDVGYTRLHGLNENHYDYDYDYDDAELRELADRLVDLAGDRERTFSLFNNFEMDANARRLAEILAKDGSESS